MKKMIPRMRMRDVAHIYDAMKIGILIVAGDGTLIWGNRYYSTLAKFDVRAYFGKHIREISIHEAVSVQGRELLFDYVLRTGEERKELVQYDTSDYVITVATPICVEEGELDYILYTCTNYSEIMRAEQELSQARVMVNTLKHALRSQRFEPVMGVNIVVKNGEMMRLFSMGNRLAEVDTSVMLLGESGVGKDILAKYIHQKSPRKEKPFVHVNLGAVPRTLFESQLFGYAPGAFTGASKEGRIGFIEMADGGTLFLDEVGELPLDIQTKLLQVVQEKTVRAIGSTQSRPVDVRFIAATNRNLKEMVEEGTFRLDLYYRLNVVELVIPPLRKRREEIPTMAAQFLAQYNKQYNQHKELSHEVLYLLQDYPWPGNVRELRHTIESLVVIGESPIIRKNHLPVEFQRMAGVMSGYQSGMEGKHSLKDVLEYVEKTAIREALETTASAKEAADFLGIDPSTLSKKRRRYEL